MDMGWCSANLDWKLSPEPLERRKDLKIGRYMKEGESETERRGPERDRDREKKRERGERREIDYLLLLIFLLLLGKWSTYPNSVRW